jgi:tRNA nucleotidyltransferase (CCA-adding enzyme)
VSDPSFDDLPLPPAIEALARSVADAGGRAWLVGGGVRDHLLGQTVKDFDVEVHGVESLDLERLLTRLGKVNAVGRSFGVFKLRPRGAPRDAPEIDVSIPRRDSNAGPGHKGIAVQGDPTMTLDEAVARRDLTINALLVDVLTRRLEDRVGGLDDLRAQRLRAVDADTFLEDPLRALRVVQFAARTGFLADDTLIGLCRRAPLDELPPERVQMELAKLFLKGRHLETALALARRAAVLTRVFPERVDDPGLDAALQGALGHRDALETAGARWALLLAVFLAASPQEAVEPTLDRMAMFTIGRYPVRRQVVALCATRDHATSTDADLRHLSTHTEVRLALRLRASLDPMGDWSARLTRAHALGVATDKPAPLLRGRDLAALGMRGGRRMGTLLTEAYTRQLDGDLTTPAEALAWARTQLPG